MVLPKEALILQFLAQFQDQLGYDDERVRILLRGLGNHHATYENGRGYKPQYLIRRDASAKNDNGSCLLNRAEDITTIGKCIDDVCDTGDKAQTYSPFCAASKRNEDQPCLVHDQIFVDIPGSCVLGACFNEDGDVEHAHHACRENLVMPKYNKP